jgi:sulfur carrier protein
MPSPPPPRNARSHYTDAMEILLNGQPHAAPDDGTILSLLHQLGIAERRVAVERNGEIVPRSQHPTTPLAANDRIEIVHAIGGG